MSKTSLRKTTYIFGVCLVVLLGIYQLAYPHFSNATYTINGETRDLRMPLYIWDEAKDVTVEMDVHLNLLRPSRYRLVPDDCIKHLWINGEEVTGENVQFCGIKGRNVDLSQHMTRSVNRVVAEIENHGGRIAFFLKVASIDPLFTVLRISIFALIVTYGLIALDLLGFRKHIRVLFGIAVAIAALMKLYDLQFFFYEYSLDWDGHLEYIEYMRSFFRIPPAQEGWEYYQPPLYYFFMAVWWYIGMALGRPTQLLYEDFETASWLMMSASLGLIIWIGIRLFREQEFRERVWFLLLCGICISLVMFASRITNDVLIHVITLAYLGLLLTWWKTHSVKTWYASIALIGIGLLTKSNAMPLLAISLICLSHAKGLSTQVKARMAALSLILIAAIAGWYLFYRFGIEGERFIVGNTLTHHLGVSNTLDTYTTFNPLEFLHYPFNNNWEDAFRRQYYWEYLFRSFFFSEFNFGDKLHSLAQLLLLLGLAFIIPTISGLIRELRKPQTYTLPLVVFSLVLVLSAVIYRLKAPYSPNQDFRFIAPVIIPLTYWLLRSIQPMAHWLQSAIYGLLSAYLIASVGFIILLSTIYR